jgi:hypothetical protein
MRKEIKSDAAKRGHPRDACVTPLRAAVEIPPAF